MFKRLIFSAMILMMPVLWQCSDGVIDPPEPPELNSMEKAMVKSTNSLSFDIFKEIVSAEEDTNVFISPLSISYALGMTYNGANGETEEAMKRVLGYGELTDQEINETYKNLTQALVGLDPDVLLEIANSIWHRNSFAVEDSFINVNQEYFDAEVAALDFNDGGACDIINGWVSEKTHEKIDKVINPPIDPLTMMFLINAVYFNGTWTYEFDEDDTHDAPFYLGDGSTVMCDMMTQKNEYSYINGDGFIALDLPYGYANFSMTVFLPDKDNNVDDLIAQFNPENWDNWMNSLHTDSLRLFMPKFRIACKYSLVPALRALGMGVAFVPFEADFSGINPSYEDLHISDVLHNTFVQVDEEGTEAAAVTVVEIGTTSVPPLNKIIRIDRPFAFVIHEKNTGAILFMGKIVNPIWEE